MTIRKLAAGLTLGTVALLAGCRSTSNRVAFSQPVVVAPGPAPCCAGAPGAPVISAQPPLGVQVPAAPCPACRGY